MHDYGKARAREPRHICITTANYPTIPTAAIGGERAA
jgi:hypothetical protein